MRYPAAIQRTAVMFLLLVSPAVSHAMEEPQNPGGETAPAESAKAADIEIGFSHEHLTDGYAPWRSEYVQVVRRFATRKVVYGRFEHTNRFSESDLGATVGGYYPLSERWTALAEVYGSPTHNVLATWSALGQIERDFGGGWAGHAGWRYRQYNMSHVGTGNFGVDKSFKSFRAGYTLYASSIENAGTSVTNRFDGTYNYGNSMLNLTFAYGQELENILPSGVLRTDVRLISFSGAHWFSTSWAASYSFSWHDQGKPYTRQGLTLGLRFRL